MIILLHGLPGVGKSTLSKALAAMTDGIVLGTNHIRKHVLKHKAYASEQVAIFPFSEEDISLSYAIMIYCAEELARAGKVVILDATFQKQSFILQAKHAAEKASTELFVLTVTCEEKICQMRMEERSKQKMSDSIVDFTHHKEMKEKHFETYPYSDFIFDTGRDYEEQLQRVKFLLLR